MTAHIDLAFARLELADLITVKALKVDELTQIARIETRLREYLSAKWNARSKVATKKAASLAKAGKSIEAVVDAIDNIMVKWPNDVVPTYKKSAAQIYKLGRVAGFKRATGQIKGDKAFIYTTENFSDSEQAVTKAEDGLGAAAELFPGFDLEDFQAIDALNKNNVFWVGQHYDKNISQSIADEVRDTMLAAGSNRTIAAEALAKALKRQFGIVNPPSGYTGSSKSYFEGLAANSATVGRVTGHVRSFEDAAVATLEVINPDDERTSKFCRHMNGKIFTIEQARAQLDSELNAASPEDVKVVHPWIGHDQLKSISPQAGPAGAKDAETLFGSQVTLPPYHMRCRTTVDVHEFK